MDSHRRGDQHRVVGTVGRELHREPDARSGDRPRQVDAAQLHRHDPHRPPHGTRPRQILPPMPIPMYKNFTDEDLEAIFTYLGTIPNVSNRVPEPLPPATQVGSR